MKIIYIYICIPYVIECIGIRGWVIIIFTGTQLIYIHFIYNSAFNGSLDSDSFQIIKGQLYKQLLKSLKWVWLPHTKIYVDIKGPYQMGSKERPKIISKFHTMVNHGGGGG